LVVDPQGWGDGRPLSIRMFAAARVFPFTSNVYTRPLRRLDGPADDLCARQAADTEQNVVGV